MFKYLPLLWANLGRKRLRTGLTLASIIVAFLLFGLMQTLRVALTGSADLAGVDRLMTMHKIVDHPAAAGELSEPHPRASRASRWRRSHDWFGGIYQDDRNQIAAFAVDAPTFFEVYPEYTLPPEQKDAWLSGPHRRDRRQGASPSASAGRSATRFRCARTSGRRRTAATSGR